MADTFEWLARHLERFPVATRLVTLIAAFVLLLWFDASSRREPKTRARQRALSYVLPASMMALIYSLFVFIGPAELTRPLHTEEWMALFGALLGNVALIRAIDSRVEVVHGLPGELTAGAIFMVAGTLIDVLAWSIVPQADRVEFPATIWATELVKAAVFLQARLMSFMSSRSSDETAVRLPETSPFVKAAASLQSRLLSVWGNRSRDETESRPLSEKADGAQEAARKRLVRVIALWIAALGVIVFGGLWFHERTYVRQFESLSMGAAFADVQARLPLGLAPSTGPDSVPGEFKLVFSKGDRREVARWYSTGVRAHFMLLGFDRGGKLVSTLFYKDTKPFWATSDSSLPRRQP